MNSFFFWSKVLPLFLYPLPLLLIVLFIASFAATPRYEREKGRKFRWLVRGIAVLLWILASPWFSNLLVQLWESPRLPLSSLPSVSDTAIVLGGLSDPALSTPDHLEFNQSAERLSEAVQLYREGRVKTILISSGSGDLSRPGLAEAPGLAAWAESMGVKSRDLLVESKSRNTYENARFSKKICDERGLHSVVLITSAYHMPRALAVFRKAGFSDGGRMLIPWAVDTQRDSRQFPFNLVADPKSLATVQLFLKEIVGYGVYAVAGYL
ncbi:MAG: YdcF family protein [Spirochaetales bacterium]|nr:YdcF family protein [Spirochaetales bacterium]